MVNTEKSELDSQDDEFSPDVMPHFFINDVVMTPDGKGIIKKIEEVYSRKIAYTCLLEKPYKVINPYNDTIDNRDYNFPEYSFGDIYSEELVKLLKKHELK